MYCKQVENRQALENFADIVGSADGVILSRGNLGLDVASEKMAMVQKVMHRALKYCLPMSGVAMPEA